MAGQTLYPLEYDHEIEEIAFAPGGMPGVHEGAVFDLSGQTAAVLSGGRSSFGTWLGEGAKAIVDEVGITMALGPEFATAATILLAEAQLLKTGGQSLDPDRVLTLLGPLIERLDASRLAAAQARTPQDKDAPAP